MNQNDLSITRCGSHKSCCQFYLGKIKEMVVSLEPEYFL